MITYLGDGKGGFTVSPHTRRSIRACSLQAGNFNGDGFADLAVAGFDPVNDTYVVRVMDGFGDGTFGEHTTVGTDSNFRAMMATADVNRDGKTDAIVFAFARGLEIWFGDGKGGFLGALGIPLTLTSTIATVKLADLNHDGLLDIVAGSVDQLAVIMNSSGGFGAPRYIPGSIQDGTFNIGAVGAVELADVNGDGDVDIFTDLGALFAGNGDGTFRAPDLFDVGPSPAGIRATDFNRDGIPDLIVGGTWGSATVLLNERNTVNHPPTVSGGADRTFTYQEMVQNDELTITATGSDPDAHAIAFEWRDQSGAVVATTPWLLLSGLRPGSYTYSVTGNDGRGGSATDTIMVTVTPTKEIVLYAGVDGVPRGSWVAVSDTTAAGGARMYNPNANAAKITTPLANPANVVGLSFVADPTMTYKLWVRLKADGNRFDNDSVYVQFSGSVDTNGNPAYRVNTTSALPVNLEECSGCGESGWGWEDDGWGAVNRNGTTIRFPAGGFQTIWIQQREDGVSIDQIVLSAEKYLTTRPGLAKNDQTILTRTFAPSPD